MNSSGVFAALSFAVKSSCIKSCISLARETEKFPDEPKAEVPAKKGYRVLAITACPTGIAHTYMAAESLQKAGDSLNIPIKVETNGSGGAKNVLTEEEIANCDGIIIAADITINLARFDGKPVLQCAVSDGIHKPEELINKIVNKEVTVPNALPTSCALTPHAISMRNAIAMKIPPATTNGSICDTPFIR